MNDPAADSPLPQAASDTAPARDPAGAANEPAGGPGARLMAERRAQGLSLGDIARQLKLSVRQVEALERDDHGTFSGAVFVRGFLRNYAKLLHLNSDSLLEQLSGPAPVVPGPGPVVAPVRMPVSETRGRRPRNFGVLGGAAILVVLVLAALYEGRQKQPPMPVAPGTLSPAGAGVSPQHAESPPPGLASTSGLVPAGSPMSSPRPGGTEVSVSTTTAAAPATPAIQSAPATTPVAAAPAAAVVPAPATAPVVAAVRPTRPAAAPAVPERNAPPAEERGAVAGSVQVRMVFEDEAWVEIKDNSGQVIFSQLSRAGSERTVKGHPPLSVIVGNAHGVRLTYRDKAVDLGPHTRVDVARVVLE